MNILLATLLFYTRLPFLQKCIVPGEYFKNIVHYWPIAGWVTAPIMALTLYTTSLVFPLTIAAILAIISRLLVTGCLHEDGLADFADGFGGGRDKAHILMIMKDSHIGTYGVMTLIIYFALLFAAFTALPVRVTCFMILAIDPFCKGLASLMTLRLDYVRREAESKFGFIPYRVTVYAQSFALVFGFMPFIFLLPVPLMRHILYVLLVATALFFYLTEVMKKKIGGYTGDCAGALFLLLEITAYLTVILILTIQ